MTEDEKEAKEYFGKVQRHFNPLHTLVHGKRQSILDLVKKEQRGLPRSTMWYRAKIKEIAGNQVNVHEMYSNEKPSHTSRPRVGRFYHFFYDPKHKLTLPYYDRFPLVIPIEYYNDGFLGLNFHYLRPHTRLLLMDNLIDLASNNFMDYRTKLRISYQLVSNVSRYPEVAPTIKRYLYKQVRSKYVLLEPEEWTIAMLLPTEQFKKSTKQQVWSESATTIRKRRVRRPGQKRK